jgi:hypothetical protein
MVTTCIDVGAIREDLSQNNYQEHEMSFDLTEQTEEEEVLDFFEDDLTRALLWADVSRHSITTRASVKSDERPVEKSDDGVNDSYSDAGQDSIRRSYAEVKSNLSEDSD